MRPKAPTNRKWRPIDPPFYLPDVYPGVKTLAFQLGRVVVFSTVAKMTAPDSSGDILPTWLVSVSEFGKTMPSDATMRRVRRAFGMERAEEDNHEPGLARKLFLVVDAARRVECECKTTEIVVEREDGYRYSQPRPAAK